MSDLLIKGYAVQEPKKGNVSEDVQAWYVPHRSVASPKKENSVVFDCAASYQGKLINRELLQSPDLTNSLIGVLTQFRCDHIALISDIEEFT